MNVRCDTCGYQSADYASREALLLRATRDGCRFHLTRGDGLIVACPRGHDADLYSQSPLRLVRHA